jgi:tetratricopeptide (TPR) repeat protein/TolB-like protein
LTNTPAEISPDPSAVASELERIAASPSFRKADQCVRLLRYVTNRTLEGHASELKEYVLGVSVFERPDSFDPRTDAVVRLEARRLRLKLAEYYQQEGLDDPVVIDLPKGAYVPRFRTRQAPSHADAPAAIPIPAARPRFRRWMIVSAATLLCISLATWYVLHRRAEKQILRTSIAVLGFRDLSARPETSWIDAAISELMNIELGAGQQLRTPPPENVARMRTELSVTPQSIYPAHLLKRIGVNLGIEYAVAGTYLPQGDRVRLDVVLFDVRSGRQIAAVGDESAQNQLVALTQGCARRIRAQLGVRLSTGQAPMGFPPVDPVAMESYSRGMERLRQSDALGARQYLESSAAAAPSNPLVHSGLAAAFSLLGLDDRARQEAKEALDSSAALGRVEQLEIEGRYRTMAHDWPRAIQVYQALVTLLPDDLEYGLLLASAQSRGGKAQDALVTVSALRNLPPPLRDDPRIDLQEAQAAGGLADFEHTRRAAHAAAEKAAQSGARLQYARARLLESGAMQSLGSAGFADVRAEARRICAELGDRACVAAAYRIEANGFAATGAPAKARPVYAAVLEIANEMGNLLEKLNALQGLAYTERLQGDLKAAEADSRAALKVGSEMGLQKTCPVLLDLAEILAAEGHISESQAMGEEALDESRKVGDRQSIGIGEAVLAHDLALKGMFSDAISKYNEAVHILREVNDRWELGFTLLNLGDAQLEDGNLEAARKTYEEARDLNSKSPGSFAQPETAMAFARLSMVAGQTEEAVGLARTAMDKFAAAGREGDRLEAAALLSRALIARGSVAEASAVLGRIPSPEGKAFPIEAVVQFRIARCLIAANAGHRAEASRAMDAIAAQVSRLGLSPLEKETRLAREAVMETASRH